MTDDTSSHPFEETAEAQETPHEEEITYGGSKPVPPHPTRTVQAPTVGSVVHYCLGEDALEQKGSIRAADVVGFNSKDPMRPNLSIKLDGANDSRWVMHGHWMKEVPFGGPETPGTWFWPT